MKLKVRVFKFEDVEVDLGDVTEGTALMQMTGAMNKIAPTANAVAAMPLALWNDGKPVRVFASESLSPGMTQVALITEVQTSDPATAAAMSQMQLRAHAEHGAHFVVRDPAGRISVVDMTMPREGVLLN